MKFYSGSHLLLFILFLFVVSCGKKNKKNNNNNVIPPVSCSLSMSSLVANDTVYNVISDTGYATMNNTFYTEHTIAAAQGSSAEFEGGNAPLAGTYNITPVFTDVTPGSHKVYLLYYNDGKTFVGQSGTVTVTGSGMSAVQEFCKVNFKDSFGDEKTVSLKSDSE